MTVTAETFLQIEEDLSSLTFQGVPIASTLGDVFSAELRADYARSPALSAVRDFLRIPYHWLRAPRATQLPIRLERNRFLLTWSNEKPYNRDLVLPVLEALGPLNCNVIGASSSMQRLLPHGAGFISWREIESAGTEAWRKEFHRSVGGWTWHVQRTLKRHRVSARVIPRLVDAMLIQARRIDTYGRLLDETLPRGIYTDYDRNMRNAPLILAAKNRGIPGMTIIHGVINPPSGYTPLLADIALCWGEQHRDQLIELGTSPTRLVVTGCPRITRGLNAHAEAARRKVGLLPQTPVVLLATNPIVPEHRRILAQTFCEAVAGCDSLQGAVRLHPSEKLEDYSAEARRFASVRFLDNSEWTLDEALAAADVVVCRDSGLGNDALVKGKLAVVLDVVPGRMGNGRALVEFAGSPCARSADELRDMVIGIQTESKVRAGFKETAERYVSYFCMEFGEAAAKNIAQQIVEKCHEASPRPER